MKKGIGLFMYILFLVSCNANSQKEETAEYITEAVTIDPVYSANYLLDYKGVYIEDEFPANSGEATQVRITLDDNNYTKEVSRGNRSICSKTIGTYKWDETGTVVTLIGEDKPNQYFVSDNTLTCLNVDGNIITGTTAGRYVLSK